MKKILRSVFSLRNSKKKLLYIILVAFLLSFLIARMWSIYYGRSVFIYGFHIHHFYFGMLLLSAGGITGVLTNKEKPLRVASLLIGAGMGLFADEIGLLLNCTTTYRICAYAFPGAYDIIMSIGLTIFIIIVAISLIDERSKKDV